MTIDKALFDTNNHVLDRDFVAKVILKFPEMRRRAPILAMLLGGIAAPGAANMAEPTRNEKFEWRDAGLIGRTDAVDNGGSAYNAGTTSIVVDTGTVFPVGSLILCDATGEIMFVTARSTNTLTVVRGIGSANGGVAAHADSVANNAVLRHIGFAKGEGAGVGVTQSHPLGAAWNYVQEFHRTVQATARAMAEAAKTEDVMPLERKLFLQEIIDDAENAILFGSRMATVDASSRRVTTMHGLYNALTTNVYNPAGTVSLNAFEETFLAPVYNAGGSDERHLFCGATILNIVDTLYASQIRRQPDDVARRFVKTVNTRQGLLHIHRELQLVGARAGEGVLLDLGQLKIRHWAQPAVGKRPAYDGLPTLHQNVGSNDVSAETDEWVAMIGLQWGSEALHGRIKGATGAA